LDYRAAGRRLHCPRHRRIFVQREVRPPLVIVGEIQLERAAQRPLVPHDDVVETLAPQGANHAFDERILPRRPRRGVPRPRLAELLGGPRWGRVRGDIQVDDAASVVGQHHNTNNTRNVAVGTVKKSIEASWET